jgi:hypothetical protein
MDRAGQHRVKLAIRRRNDALERPELRQPSSPRAPAAGVTSFPLKAVDEKLRAEVEAWRAKRRSR